MKEFEYPPSGVSGVVLSGPDAGFQVIFERADTDGTRVRSLWNNDFENVSAVTAAEVADWLGVNVVEWVGLPVPPVGAGN